MKETFGQRLHRLRIAAALSQTELGKLIGRALGSAPISKGAISQWENDQIGSLKDENLLALARVLKMPPEELKSGALNGSLGSLGLSASGTVGPAAAGDADITSSMLRSPDGRRLATRLQVLEQAGRLSPPVVEALERVLDLAEPAPSKYQRLKDKAHAAQDPAE